MPLGCRNRIKRGYERSCVRGVLEGAWKRSDEEGGNRRRLVMRVGS